MSRRALLASPGIAAGLGAALLFGVGTPLAKQLLQGMSPWLLAALLYLGSGLGLTLYRLVRGEFPWQWPTLSAAQWWCLLAAVALGGGVAPVLLMFGLVGTPAASASWLLNAEMVFTAALAWLVFQENLDRRVVLGLLSILGGAVVLGLPEDLNATLKGSVQWPALWVLGACLAWGLDNNFTRKVALADAAWITSVKGLVAGSVNLAIALALGTSMPGTMQAAAAMGTGFFAYGVSLALFVVALRHLGAARAGAFFSIAPFAGALVSVLWLGEAWTWPLLLAGALMALGVWLCLSEQHEHLHRHEPLEHEHEHLHGLGEDGHHEHDHHDPSAAAPLEHGHWHRHAPVTHSHRHYPDAHHQHDH